MSSNKINIAIDGPAGSGKSTTAKRIASLLGYVHLDTGAMYRAVALAWLQKGYTETEEDLKRLMSEISIELRLTDDGQRTYLDGRDVSDEIRTPEVSKWASPLSAWQVVRTKLVKMQQYFGKDGGIVADGRDIATVVYPDAKVKVFLTASLQARAERRALELKNNGFEVNIEEIKAQIAERDKNDSTRANSPLTKTEESIEIDSSNLSIDEQVQIIYKIAESKLNSLN